jgi:hypothetical protein
MKLRDFKLKVTSSGKHYIVNDGGVAVATCTVSKQHPFHKKLVIYYCGARYPFYYNSALKEKLLSVKMQDIVLEKVLTYDDYGLCVRKELWDREGRTLEDIADWVDKVVHYDSNDKISVYMFSTMWVYQRVVPLCMRVGGIDWDFCPEHEAGKGSFFTCYGLQSHRNLQDRKELIEATKKDFALSRLSMHDVNTGCYKYLFNVTHNHLYKISKYGFMLKDTGTWLKSTYLLGDELESMERTDALDSIFDLLSSNKDNRALGSLFLKERMFDKLLDHET